MRGVFSSLLLLLPVVVGKLLRVNEWYGLNLPPKATAALQMSLFYSCDRATIVVKAGKELSSRLLLYFDGKTLEQIDVDSTQVATLPQTQKVIGSCREKERKSVSLNITSGFDFFELDIDGQFFRRPKARKRNNLLQIGLLQEVPCCVIKAVLLTDSEDIAMTETTFTTTSDTPLTTTMTFDAPYPAQQVSKRMKTAVSTAAPQEYRLYNWTDVVNREWSNAFLICAGATCALMTALVIFGLASWMYLLTKPSDAATLYRVDTPTPSVF